MGHSHAVLQEEGAQTEGRRAEHTSLSASSATNENRDVPTGEIIYARYYRDPVTRILIPFFFVSLFIYTSHSAKKRLTISGIHRFCDSDNSNVQRKYRLAWHGLCNFDDLWKNGHRFMAHTFFSQSHG